MEDLRIDLADVAFIETLVAGCGLETPSVLSEIGLPADLFSAEGPGAISMFDYVRIFRYLTEATGDETCTGSGRQILAGTTPFLLRSVPVGTLMGDVFQRLADGYNFAHGGTYNIIRKSPGRLSYCIDDSKFPYTDDIFKQHSNSFIESILVSLHVLFCELAGASLSGRVLRVLTKRSEDDPGGSFLKFWGAPIAYGADYHAVQYDGRIADLTIQKIPLAAYTTIFDAASEQTVARAGIATPEQSWAEKMRQIITAGVSDQAAVAARLGVSVATMRRRLSAEHTSFRELRAEALNARAHRLLGRGDPVVKVAEELGFADLRSFSRAFKSWNDVTPTAFQSGAPRQAASR